MSMTADTLAHTQMVPAHEPRPPAPTDETVAVTPPRRLLASGWAKIRYNEGQYEIARSLAVLVAPFEADNERPSPPAAHAAPTKPTSTLRHGSSGWATIHWLWVVQSGHSGAATNDDRMEGFCHRVLHQHRPCRGQWFRHGFAVGAQRTRLCSSNSALNW